MAVTEGFKDFVQDLLGDFGPVGIRNMFGGAGVYADGVMFAILADDTLYLKADETSARVRKRGHEPLHLSPGRQSAGRHVLLGSARALAGGPGRAFRLGAASPPHRLRKQSQIVTKIALT